MEPKILENNVIPEKHKYSSKFFEELLDAVSDQAIPKGVCPACLKAITSYKSYLRKDQTIYALFVCKNEGHAFHEECFIRKILHVEKCVDYVGDHLWKDKELYCRGCQNFT